MQVPYHPILGFYRAIVLRVVIILRYFGARADLRLVKLKEVALS